MSYILILEFFLHNRSAILCLADICLLLIAYRHRQKSVNMCRPGGGDKKQAEIRIFLTCHTCVRMHIARLLWLTSCHCNCSCVQDAIDHIAIGSHLVLVA